MLGRERRAVVTHGSSYDGAPARRIEERYEGAVGVCRTQPRERRGQRAARRYVIEWPEADCATEAHLELRSDAGAYHVVVEVVASEDGPDGIGHVERRFERTIPRRLQ